ncbi:beta-1,3-galactosyltransferase pvg3-like [Lolium rigidum]|uniref:beta-1,3-galactosyltransferase pvg3-like n=1 Tax=Lolium rigidum TaxID=89674 RepID=UPI001F5CFD08|nr:beta-1,3-galactosyltransferase pvg3-like [Lolium rigidum]
MTSKAPSSTSYLLLAPVAVLLLVFLLSSVNRSGGGSDGLGVLCTRRAVADNYTVVSEEAPSKPELSLLVGILTMPKLRERRDIVRLAYALQPPVPAYARVDVRFVFCSVTDPVDAMLVSLEAAHHGDIIVLDCTENMNNGKTYAYFSSVPRIFADAPYDYVMKTDDDAYLRVPALVEELRGKPRDDVYLGWGFNMSGDPMLFMHGMGYVMSWDLVSWVATAEEILERNDTVGPEDLMLGKWVNLAGKGKNRYDLKPRMYDLNWDMDNLRPDTVLVHTLKNNRRWATTLEYFNVTAGIKPSNLP